MTTCLWILLGLTLNFALGVLVFALLDDEEERLLQWFLEAPDPRFLVQYLTVQLWPAILVFRIQMMIEERKT